MRFIYQFRIFVAILAVILSSPAAFAQTAYTPLDLSAGFNTDLWCGPTEYAQVKQTWTTDILELQGGSPTVGWVVAGGGLLYLSNTSPTGSNLVYSYPGSYPNHPYYMTGDYGTPEDGYILSTNNTPYHIASVLGNTTLPGDWTEVADPQASAWITKPNGVRVGCPHRNETWQIASQIIELPADQKSQYDSVNFVIATHAVSDRARNMQIVALYGPTGADEQILHSFSVDEGGSGPRSDDTSAPAGFNIVYTSSKVYTNDAGPTGSMTSTALRNFYEFAAPISLDNTKTLFGFRVEDTNPTLNNNARGLVIFAATAIKAQPSNTLPTPDAGADQTVYDMDQDGSADAQLDGRNSNDPDGQILKYQWSEGATQLAIGATPVLPLTTGAHTLTLTVTDNSLATNTDTLTITIAGPPAGAPTADAGPDQTLIDADANFTESVTLDASASTDADGTITSYQWLQGLDEIAAGISPTISLPVGVHNIELRITDNDGYYNVDTVVITIQSSEPIANAGPDQFQMADPSGDKTITLDASASSDPAGTIVSYLWEEASTQIATGVNPGVLFAEGTHNLTLTVTDDSTFTDTDTVTITVGPYLPPTTYYLDDDATGPNFDGSQSDPWQTVEQMQQFFFDKSGHGSGDTVIIAPGSYGDFVDGAVNTASVPYSQLQKAVLPRTDWLTLIAADPNDKPVFSYIQFYGERDVYVELNNLHIYQEEPYNGACMLIRGGTDNIRVLNMEIETDFGKVALPAGIWITYQSPSNILIENNNIHHTGIGISAGADNLLIRNNEIHDNEGSGVQTGWGSNNVVEGNYIHDQVSRFVRLQLFGSITGSFAYGENVTQDVTGATGTVYASHAGDIEIYPTNHVDMEFIVGHPVRNDADSAQISALTAVTVSDTTHASGLSVRTIGYIARNNTLVRVGNSSSIKTYEVQGGALPFTDMLFENNLVYDAIAGHTASFGEIGDNFVLRNNTFIGSPGFVFHSSNDGSGLKLYNNVFQSLSIYHTDYLPNVTEDGNVYTFLNVRYPTWSNYAQFPNPSSSVRYEFIIYDDPATFAPFWALFNDPDNKDFSLAPGSPAINLAIPAQATTYDILGILRDILPDAGAFEFTGSGSQVIARNIFYNNSSFDGNDPAANSADDNAIATDKSPLLPGQTATLANYTSYSKGINGLMVDIFNLPTSLTSADFEFKNGNTTDPATWAAAPAPSGITLRTGEGLNGTDRVTITFADGAISKKWLQVKVLANENTGLTADDTFYIANAIGDTGNSPTDTIVDSTDEIAARNNPRTFIRPATIENLCDFNRDGKVNATDQIIARNNVTDFTNDLELITAP